MIRSMRATTVGLALVALLLGGAACAGSDQVGSGDGHVTTSAAPGTAPSGSAPATAQTAAGEVAPRPSAGCGAVPADLVTGEVEQRTIASGGQSREYRQLVPSSYDGTTPMPVVLDYHGLLEGAAMHAESDQWEAFGEANGIIVVTPQGLGPVVHWTITNSADNVDVVFTTDLLDSLEQTMCIDTARVYVNGLSNGGMMSSTLACQLPERIAAIGNVSGMLAPPDCEPGRPVPVMVFWGSRDPLLLYEGGMGESVPAGAGTIGFDPVEDMVAFWAGLAGCGPEPEVVDFSEHIEERSWPGCADGSQVILYTITNGGHTWPGSAMYQRMGASSAPTDGTEDKRGVTTDEIDATAVLWEFFRAHPLAG